MSSSKLPFVNCSPDRGPYLRHIVRFPDGNLAAKKGSLHPEDALLRADGAVAVAHVVLTVVEWDVRKREAEASTVAASGVGLGLGLLCGRHGDLATCE